MTVGAVMTAGRALATAETTRAPGPPWSVVTAVLASAGAPLDGQVREVMEPRLGFDFGNVRIHTDARAASAAFALGAHAFTVGEHVVFGANAYRPESRWGRGLLAHELTHVVQQAAAVSAGVDGVAAGPEAPPEFEHSAREAAGSGSVAALPSLGTPMIQRAGFLQTIARFFGGGTFSVQELVTYLATLRRTGQIEDNYDSDNKARDVVRRSRAGQTQFSGLTESIRVLLIKEMLAGYVSGADEDAVLDLLTEAPPPEALRMISAVGEPTLRRSFSGDNRKRLVALIDSAELAPSTSANWTARRVTTILRHEGREGVLANLVSAGWGVWSFVTAFDTWRYPDGRTEEEEVVGLRGNTDRTAKLVRLNERLDDEGAASTLLHESRHVVGGPPTSPVAAVARQQGLQQEVDARVATEEYAIRRGLPPSRPGYRKPDGTVDVTFIRDQIFTSPHYNPTTRRRVGQRRWVGDHPVQGMPRGGPP